MDAWKSSWKFITAGEKNWNAEKKSGMTGKILRGFKLPGKNLEFQKMSGKNLRLEKKTGMAGKILDSLKLLGQKIWNVGKCQKNNLRCPKIFECLEKVSDVSNCRKKYGMSENVRKNSTLWKKVKNVGKCQEKIYDARKKSWMPRKSLGCLKRKYGMSENVRKNSTSPGKNPQCLEKFFTD